ncbi:hypothetical protein [Grimontia hollisae]|uniref:hypothetical protein n=1 Tax=Grimontia hollisae TaxID=673 RepID=UPI0012AC921B|nr:hypothetical protein [Grimontia hollisae]
MSSNNPIHLNEQLRQLIEWLNVIVLGGENDGFWHNGVFKPSNEKAFADRFVALQAMVEGKKAYETYANLPPSASPDSPLAEVWNDPLKDNNGLYGWTADGWQKSPYDTYSLLRTDLSKVESKANHLEMMFGGTPIVVTDSGEVPVGLDKEGNLVIGGLVMSRLSVKNDVKGPEPLHIVDENDNVIFSLRRDGTVEISALRIQSLLNGVGGSVADLDENGQLHLKKISYDGLKEQDVAVPALLWAMADEDGKVAFGIDRDGTVYAGSGLKFAGADFYSDSNPTAFAITDETGKVVLAITRDGEVVTNLKKRVEVNLYAMSERRSRVSRNHIMMHGQSLSVASAGSVIRLDDGDKTFSGGHNITTDHTGNVWSSSATSGSSGVQYVAMQQMKWLMMQDAHYRQDYEIVSSAFGVSGAPIEAIDKGTEAWTNGLWQVQEGMRLSDADSTDYQVQAMGWMQGESNRNDTQQAYLAKLLQMHEDFFADVSAITGQSWKPHMYVYQLGSEQYWLDGTDLEPQVAAALLEASQTQPTIHLVSPTYYIPHPDGVHFNAVGYQHFGQQWGKVLYRSLYRGEAWKPLQPEHSYRLNQNRIMVEFHVPEPPLVLDTNTVVNPGNFGFRVRQNGQDVAIKSVSLVNANTVCIHCEEAVLDGAEVSYAWYANGRVNGGPETGPRGNLRDSDNTPACYGEQFPLHNWCVRFKQTIGA